MEEVTSPALQGKYEIGRQLGRGSFAKVYLARHVITGEHVALKVIPKEKIIKAGMMDQIKREISAMKAVSSHPNIVHLREVLATKTKIYLAMELVRGGELFAKISRHGRLREDAARAYFRQLISAVDFCHSRGVFHRDLKPENLLLDEAGNLKIADFGLSAFASPDGLFKTTCGTPAYVAPEVLTKKGYDGAKADVWSCGVILYVILAGALPFQDDNLASLYKKIVRADFRCPPWLSADARRLLLRLLDPNPGTRISLQNALQSPWLSRQPMPRSTSAPELRQSTSSPPEQLNAFHIISLSRGCDLTGLFEEKAMMRFATREPASGVISRLEEAAAKAGEGFWVEKSEHGVRIEGRRGGRKGPLAVAAEIYNVAPSWLMVELKKDGGDTLEYRSFCSDELRPALKDIGWAAAA